MGALKYRIVTEWNDEDRVYVARIPTLGCVAHGDTAASAAQEAEQAAELMLEVFAEDGRSPPPPDQTAYSGNIRLRLPRRLHARLASLADTEGVSLNQLMVSVLAEAAGGMTETKAK